MDRLGERDFRLPLRRGGDGGVNTPLKFRNITASPQDPVETWPFEGVLAAVERGTLPDWRRLARAIQADPWGPVAQQVLEAVQVRGLVRASGLSQQDFAARLGTSRSRLSTYMSGKVMPSAALMVRMRQAASRAVT